MDDHHAILNLLHDYVDAVDRKDWEKLGREIFTNEIDVDFVTWQAHTPAEAVHHIRSAIDRCGRTQHLLGSSRVEIDGDVAQAHTYVRAFHMGKGALAGDSYEMAGAYRDELRRTEAGWRIASRRGRLHFEQGNPAVLAPPA